MGIKKRAITSNVLADEGKSSISNNISIANPTTQIHKLHNDTDGFIALLRKINDGVIQRHYKVETIAEHLKEWMTYDSYISMNTFYTPKRLITNLREIRTAFVDIDCYNTGFTPVQIDMLLRADYFGREIPTPNMIIYSGRGLNLVWFLEPLSGLAVDRWDKLQRTIATKCRSIGADLKAIDAARIFRLAGSINSKNNEIVYFELLHEYRYEISEIVEEYFPEITKSVAPPKTKKPKTKSKANRGVRRLFNEYTLLKARLSDIPTLINQREGKMEGCREYALFLYRYWRLCETGSKEQAKTDMLMINDMFEKPLLEREALSDTKSAERYYDGDEAFKITNARIIEWLNITDEEQRCLATIISPAEKRRRDREYRQEKRRSEGVKSQSEYNDQRKADKAEKVAYLKELKAKYPKATQRELAAFMGVSVGTINNLLKKT